MFTYQHNLSHLVKRNDFLLQAVDLARQAQVDFKVQIQEWKNTILYGMDPKTFERYNTAFFTQVTAVQA
jgi:hypothetical protein